MGKRIFDLIFATAGLCLLSPLLLLIMLLIIIFDRESPFFLQQRVGKNGRSFPLIKFRTMKPGRSSVKNEFEAGQTHRITHFGKFLRKTKLDELPQLINVLKGDMSLVGPRPEVKKWTQVYPEKWKIVHRVKPGITDNASIVYRNEEKILAAAKNPEVIYQEVILPEKLKLNIEYVYNQSLVEDSKIILKTIKTIFIN